MIRGFLLKIAPYFLFAIYKFLQWTWKIQVHESELVKKLISENKSFVIAHWHGDEFGIIHLIKSYHVCSIVSTSKDGELMNKAVQLLGGETSRGSSTRGGTQALKGMLKLIKKGWRPSVAVDGPKGPIYQVKPGVFQVSRLTQLPIIPLSFHSSKSHIFHKAWNKSHLPLPFSRVTVVWGEEMTAVARDADLRGPELANELKKRLNDTRKMAETLASKSNS